MWIGVDLGGTKISCTALDDQGQELVRQRVATPRNDYTATLTAIADLVQSVSAHAGSGALPSPIGIGIPGSLSPRDGGVQNANSTWLNGRAFGEDAAKALGRPVKVANDANCFIRSEAQDGAAHGARVAFGVILGTGTGGAVALHGEPLHGPNAICGEWGHNPLPWARPPEDPEISEVPDISEVPGPACWCGRHGCLETWLSGPGLAADHARHTGEAIASEEIVARAGNGDAAAQAALDRHRDRLARGLASVVNVIDPDVIVLGGGLSRLPHLYDQLDEAVAAYVFARLPRICIRPPVFGDDSGVRGAALLARTTRDDAAT